MILRRVNLPGVSYCAEPISLGYHTPASHLLKLVLKSPRGMIPQQVSAKSSQLGPPTTTHALLV